MHVSQGVGRRSLRSAWTKPPKLTDSTSTMRPDRGREDGVERPGAAALREPVCELAPVRGVDPGERGGGLRSHPDDPGSGLLVEVVLAHELASLGAKHRLGDEVQPVRPVGHQEVGLLEQRCDERGGDLELGRELRDGGHADLAAQDGGKKLGRELAQRPVFIARVVVLRTRHEARGIDRRGKFLDVVCHSIALWVRHPGTDRVLCGRPYVLGHSKVPAGFRRARGNEHRAADRVRRTEPVVS